MNTFEPPDPDAWKGPPKPYDDEALRAYVDKRAEEAIRQLEEHVKERKDYRAKLKAEGFDFNHFVKECARWSWTRDGLDFWLCIHPTMRHWAGYVRFPKRPLKEAGRHGIVAYVPVHGGVTWAEDSPDGSMVYGFDVNHALDRHWLPLEELQRVLRKPRSQRREAHLLGKPIRRTRKWLTAQVEMMAAGIQAATRYEDAYLAAEGDTQARAQALENYHRYLFTEGLGQFNFMDNTQAIINVLSGNL